MMATESRKSSSTPSCSSCMAAVVVVVTALRKLRLCFLILVVMEGCIVEEPVLRGGNEANSVELSDF